ncbi:MAG: MATE family efflux transporter [Alphaproteobacteria bacterium]|nr:MATE family efflux transporter [Rhodospirillales bacterium]MCW9044716.1 MATE family efflux transporter [Alphaproteobacteria bacterium]
MITKERLARINLVALPMVGGMISQNLLNLVDTAMVGQLGSASLAAVGIGGFASYMAMSVIIGLASGVQAMVARRIGEERHNESAIPLNGGLFLALIIAVPLSITLYMFTPDLFPLLNSDVAVQEEGIPYFQARMIGVLAIGMNFSFRGYFAGVSQAKLYLRTIIIMHLANVVISYVLIFGKFGFPALGAEGAGLGTSISVYLGTLIYFIVAYRTGRERGFFHRIPSRETMVTMLRLALPSALQQFMFAAGLTAMLWIIGLVGTNEVAAYHVLITFLLVALLPGMGLGLAALTLVGEALGRKEPNDAMEWGWDVTKVASISMMLIGLPGLFFPDLLLSGFIHDPEVLDIARIPLQIMCGTIIFEAVGAVLMNALLGAGAAKQVMIVSIVSQWVFVLPIAYVVGPYLGGGLFWIWLASGIPRNLQAIVFATMWARGKWAMIKI